MLKQQVLSNIIMSILVFIFGLILCFADSEKLLNFILVAIGLFVIFNGFLYLLAMKYSFTDKERNNNLIFSIVCFTVGFALLVFRFLVAYIFVGCVLIALPIYKIIVNKEHFESLKKEFVKIIIGLLVIICGLSYSFKSILIVAGIVVMVLSIIYIIYNLILLVKISKLEKKEEKDNDIIDV